MFRKFFLLILSLIIHANIYGCDCILTPLNSHIKTTKYIVKAKAEMLLDTLDTDKVRNYRPSNGSYEAIIYINKRYKWRGKKSPQIKISSDFSNCDIYYRKGEEYILFLTKKGRKYFIRQCSYSEVVDNKSEVLTALEKL